MKSASPPETVHDQHTKGRSWQSIQGRLYLVLFILLVPTLLIQAYAYYDRFQERRAEELQANLEIARSVAKTFDAFIQDILHEELVMGLAITSSGSMTSQDITRLLEQAQLGQAAVRDFSWVSRDGQFLYSSNPAMVGSNNSDRAYFRDIAGGREWTVGELVLARTTGKPVFGITRGIRDDHGALLGLVVATVIPERLDALLSLERSKGGAISIVDNKGTLVYRYPAINPNWEERNWLRLYPECEEVFQGKEVTKVFYAGYEGKKRTVALVPIASIGWAAGAGRTEAIALEAVTSGLLPEAALFLLVTLTAFGAALGLSRFISTPVQRLRNHALALGRGEKDDLPPVSGPAELLDLADAIRMMAQEIRSRETEIISLAQDAQQRAAEAEEGRRVIETIMDAVPAAIWVADDPECHFMTGNRTAYELLEMEPGSNISKTAPEGERPVHFKALKDGVEIPLGELPVQVAAKGKAIRDYEFELCFHNGESRCVFGNAAPLINQQGEVYGSVAAFMDITDRKRTEASLREAHERAVWLARFPEENPSPVLRVSAEGNILYRNRAAAELPEWLCKVDKLLPGLLLPLVGQALRELREIQQDVELGERFYSVSIMPFPEERYANVYGRDITERKQAEDALRRSETILRAVTETTPDLVFMKDVEGKVMMANPAALRAIGGTAGQVIGKQDHEFHEDPAIAQSIIENDRRIMLSGQIEEVEETIKTPAGRRVFLSSKAPYRDVEGRIAGLIGVSRDITERKKQEEELRRLNRTLRALSNANQAMIHADNEVDLLNEVCRIVVEDCGHAMVWIGFAEEDEGKTVWPVAQAGFEEGYLETLQVTWADTERGRGPTGTAIRSGIVNACKNMATDSRMHPWREQAIKRGYASSIALPLKAENRVYGALTIYARNPDSFSEDEVKLLVELADDLTYGITAIRLRLAHQQAEATLRNSETRFRLLSETASVLLASEDPQRIVNELCRKVMEHLDCHAFFNFLADEQVGRLHLNAWAGIPEEEAKKIEWLDYGVAVCGCAAQQGCRIVAENILTTPDLRTELVKSYGIQAYACHPLMAQGRVRGTLSFGTRMRPRFSPQDLALMETVTTQVATAMERIRLIGDLKTSRDELEIRVQERTGELRKMNEALKQSNRDLEDFAYVASHDLQEPLRKIQTFADWLVAEQQESLNEKVRDYLERMRRAARRMQSLVQDLLRYSRITSKPEPFARFGLREPVEEAILDLEVLREETEGHVEVEELPDIEADRVQMHQLFQNLISNGLKYHGEQTPVVKVYSRSSSSPGFWEIHVKDNGIGFDEGYLDKIFKPFQRLHGRSAPYQGTGIGLAICRRIVERHGGSITAESKPGEGATFIVKLPKKRLTSEMNP